MDPLLYSQNDLSFFSAVNHDLNLNKENAGILKAAEPTIAEDIFQEEPIDDEDESLQWLINEASKFIWNVCKGIFSGLNQLCFKAEEGWHIIRTGGYIRSFRDARLDLMQTRLHDLQTRIQRRVDPLSQHDDLIASVNQLFIQTRTYLDHICAKILINSNNPVPVVVVGAAGQPEKTLNDFVDAYITNFQQNFTICTEDELVKKVENIYKEFITNKLIRIDQEIQRIVDDFKNKVDPEGGRMIQYQGNWVTTPTLDSILWANIALRTNRDQIEETKNQLKSDNSFDQLHSINAYAVQHHSVAVKALQKTINELPCTEEVIVKNLKKDLAKSYDSLSIEFENKLIAKYKSVENTFSCFVKSPKEVLNDKKFLDSALKQGANDEFSDFQGLSAKTYIEDSRNTFNKFLKDEKEKLFQEITTFSAQAVPRHEATFRTVFAIQEKINNLDQTVAKERDKILAELDQKLEITVNQVLDEKKRQEDEANAAIREQEIISQIDPNFKRVEVPRNGNCLFASALEILKAKGKYVQMSVQDYRKSVYEFIEHSIAEHSNVEGSIEDFKGDIQAYLTQCIEDVQKGMAIPGCAPKLLEAFNKLQEYRFEADRETVKLAVDSQQFDSFKLLWQNRGLGQMPENVEKAFKEKKPELNSLFFEAVKIKLYEPKVNEFITSEEDGAGYKLYLSVMKDSSSFGADVELKAICYKEQMPTKYYKINKQLEYQLESTPNTDIVYSKEKAMHFVYLTSSTPHYDALIYTPPA